MEQDITKAAEEWACRNGAHSYAFQWAVDDYIAGSKTALNQYSDAELEAELRRRKDQNSALSQRKHS